MLFADYYLPGYKSGGLTRSVANFVEDVEGRCEIRILTRDRDLGDRHRYVGIPSRRWVRVGRALVAYLDWSSPRDLAWALTQVRRTRPDLLYLNSYMSPFSSILPLMAYRLRLTRAPMLIAPRGELSDQALSLKARKKGLYRKIASTLNLHRDVVFHASTPMEAKDVARFHTQNRILVSADRLRRAGAPALSVPSRPVRLAHISRLAPIKNLDRVIGALRYVSLPIVLDIWGPVEDQDYWNLCKRRTDGLPPHIAVTHRGVLDPDKVHSTLSEYHALVLCSLSENFGQIVAESLAAGCPVIVSKSLHWAQLVDGIAGWAVDPLDEREISAVLSCVADTSDEQWRDLRRGCSKALRRLLDLHSGIGSLELIDSALQGGRASARGIRKPG
ncbi:glycosyltransferase [Actinopolymorpha sp. B17G11]|uniref:glycosyltransferase n=1 Tax=Actinopolymorpha sp. B17G11 TaxID=3160861 RepID=UPI0032E4E753